MKDLLTACPALGPILRHAQEVSGYLWERGWAERNAGNLSIDVTDLISSAANGLRRAGSRELPVAYPTLARRCYMVTGTGRRFRDFARDAEHNGVLLRLGDAGADYAVLWGGLDIPGLRPTSEFPSHLRLQEYLHSNDGQGIVVLHTHPTELIALTHMPECRAEAGLNHALWSVHPEMKVFLPRGVGLVPYCLPGSERLGLETVEVMRRNHSVAVWQYHGCLAVGDDIVEAFDLIDTVNKAARIYLLCRAAGHRPDGLGPDELSELTELATIFSSPTGTDTR